MNTSILLPFKGARMVNERTNLPKIWLLVHENATYVSNVLASERANRNLTALNEIDQNNLALLEDVPASNWHALCTAAGMTVYGAVALSWCKDAKIEDTWKGWGQSGFPLKPKPEYERPARFINPDLLPKTTSLQALAEAAKNKPLPLCAMITALGDTPLDFDMPEDQLKGAIPQVAAFLLKKMSVQDNPNPALIAHWTQAIEGTEYA